MEKYLKTPYFIAAGIGFLAGAVVTVASVKAYNFVAKHIGVTEITAS